MSEACQLAGTREIARGTERGNLKLSISRYGAASSQLSCVPLHVRALASPGDGIDAIPAAIIASPKPDRKGPAS